ncbi:MAG: Asp-tRNA(Asn)/Glu-tRNA(Gln) amidotransferase GatCAB subunit C [Candidatus Staskawiczbacteria bacterium CG10_big_fil_rev_8_21_14_0_10_38_10]|uniref:Aspartyl/glutamyl-tRNA(Asn/Gln) amidotransferase subunit C n=1 Tax=Candidatus Staskawiczbacteria bacterium CG10_big_fil_rev_8_21_14_0_10_38_10 TaxID=1974891 RepID=A0A2H9T1M6_9BACT|nr:MAG: Asp-tRNA(Asn)/Glu-tRNA(Gln) amidotransferase GatCAB subunit C [Candidatus Staskawiczbacteria bacterium CG10_big_fil_rev_8_21_14_0_10_38_10]
MISKKEVEHIAKLARLRLTETEVTKMQKEISEILDYFNLLKEVDVKNLKNEGFPQIENAFRDDIKRPGGRETVNKLLEEMPEREKDYLKVKNVFKR